HELVKQGRGQRAGELAAQWLRCAASLPVRLGLPLGAARMLSRAREWVAWLREADPTLGDAATRLAATLAQAQPREDRSQLVHGTFYARHVLDLGDGAGLRSEEHTSELQSLRHLVCRLLLEKKKKNNKTTH